MSDGTRNVCGSDSQKGLSILVAIWKAFWAHPIEYFPRELDQYNQEKPISVDDAIKRIAAVTHNFTVSEGKELDTALSRARETLDEVKALTEYQDQKATRLLTIITFLSGFSGVLFMRFAENFPIWGTLEKLGRRDYYLVAGTYLSFAVFILFVVSGALVIFHATRTTFKYPNFKYASNNVQTKSYLFYREIVATTPEGWATSFFSLGQNGAMNDRPKLRDDLNCVYYQNYVTESYLIACKVADKIRFLTPGQRILSISIRVLLVWLILLAATYLCVVPPKSELSTGISLPCNCTLLSLDMLPKIKSRFMVQWT